MDNKQGKLAIVSRKNVCIQLTLDNRDTAKLTHPLYSSGFFFTNASIKLVAAVTTPICWSFSKWMMRLVHSPPGMISGQVRNRRNKHRAADCLTTSIVSPDTNNFGMSFENDSAISRLPMLAMHCNARFTWIGFREFRSFLMLWMISLIRSLFVFTSTEMNKYPCQRQNKVENQLQDENLTQTREGNYRMVKMVNPHPVANSLTILTICFSEYLFDDNKLTASMWPKSMSWPSKNMNNNLQTYFFFW